MKVAIFRWRALIPLVLLLVLLAAAWLLLADRLGRIAVERGGTAILGARVDVGSLHISLGEGKITIRRLVAASPFDSLKNLVEADELTADMDLLPLLEKKVSIDRLAATGLRFGTERTRSGFVGGGGSTAASQIMANVRSWAAQPALQVPILQLATGQLKVDSLDPRKLQTVQAAAALAGRVDSSRQAWTVALDSLDARGTADSAIAFAKRLQGARPTDLTLLRDARRMLDRVKQTRDRLGVLERGVKAGVGTLGQGLASLDSARRRDYDFARSLVRLPPIDATAIGWVLFGPEAVHKFQRALYYTELGRAYMPPGLLPRAHPSPARRAGTTVEFPRANRPPAFLLRDAELSFLLESDSGAPRRYSGRLQGLTSTPALYGRPTTLEVRAPTLSADGLFDHVHATARDAVGATVRGVTLPTIALPGLPLRVDPGRGDVSLGFALYGDSLKARWTVSARTAVWRRDSGAVAGSGLAADLLWRVVSGIETLDLTAELGGTLSHPELHVRSNLDQAVSDRLRSMIGAEVDAAESRLRVAVDRFADEKVAPVKAQVADVTAQVNARVQQGQQALQTAQHQIEQQLKRLTGGIRLP